jgi:metacaspase-1
MSHVFISTMRANPRQSYIQVCYRLRLHSSILILCVQVLQNTRVSLANKYKQIPQLSVGGLYDLDQPVNVSIAFILIRRMNLMHVLVLDESE